MDSAHTLSVNSTVDRWYNASSSTPLSSTHNHRLSSHEETTDEHGHGDLTCCQSWPSLLLFFFVVAGVAGNTLVCCAVAVERKLRNVTNYFLVSLAVADLLVSVVVMPSCIAHDLIGKENMIFFWFRGRRQTFCSSAQNSRDL